MTDHIFLSPHYDDAIGSCGGTMWRLQAAGHRVRMLTIFGGDETLPLSDDAIRFHAEAGNLAGVAARREEDRQASVRLRCSAEHLGHADAIYRCDDNGRHLYPTRMSTVGAVSPQETTFAEAIAEEIGARLPKNDAVVLCPMAIGQHVDHVLTRDSGMVLAARGFDVIFYADFYYSAHARPRLRRALSVHARPIGASALARKVTAFSRYRSQVVAMFRRRSVMYAHFWRHGRVECLVPMHVFQATLAPLTGAVPAT